MIKYQQCPVCGSNNILYQLVVKDYTVSKQSFEIWQCNSCTVRFTQNIPNQEAIGAFYKSENYISHSDTKKGLVNWLYHLVRKKTLRSKKKLIIKESQLQKAQVLDIGCGTGAFLYDMQQSGWSITGIEPDENAREKAGQLLEIPVYPPEKLFDLNSSAYDVITMWHVLEHVHDLHGYLKQINNLLKDDGILFIAVPNYTSSDAAMYKQHWAAYDVPRHLYHFSPPSMEQLLQQHGMQVKKIEPMWFDSFYVCLLSEQYKNGKSNFIKAIWNGLKSNYRALKNKKKCSSIIYIIEKKK
jgi:2-polyprenyl-3-methyl-5-hydroxy-6-metoxy-1,4-benzoquinol methylase